MATILLIDDSKTLRSSARYILETEGYAIIEADDGTTGLATLKSLSANQVTDLKMIIVDVNMPTMDGITFIREVKQTEFSHLPVLVMTTESQKYMMSEGKTAGAIGWVVKPFQSDTLLKVVASFTK